MPTLSRSRRQVASSRPPNSQARVRRATGSKARQSQTLFFPVHEVPHLVDLHDLARRLARGLRRRLAGGAQPPVDRDVADAQELGDHALAGVAHGVEQDRQGLHGLGFAALRRGGEVAAAGLAEVALVAPYPAVLDERRPGAPLAAHLDQPCPPDPAVEPSYQAVNLWVNVSVAADWIWWNLGNPPSLTSTFATVVVEKGEGVVWHRPEETARLLDLMSETNLRRVEDAKRA